jgi:murein DD-endopeptidase MepM/ murein hydrolase activator NlpD
MDRRAPLLLALVVLGLPGCERAPPRTVVVPPPASLPDSAVLKPQAANAPPSADMSAAATAPAPSARPAPPRDGAGVAGRNVGDPQGAQLLAARALLVPVAGIAPASLADNYQQGRAGHLHAAIDILAPAGTAVVAVDDGRIAKLFTSRTGGVTVYQFDRAGRLAYYYAHLQAYAPGLREGLELKRGDAIGSVGSTGNADPGAPHLHFAVFRLGTPARWWEGEAVNPYPALRRAAPADQVASRAPGRAGRSAGTAARLAPAARWRSTARRRNPAPGSHCGPPARLPAAGRRSARGRTWP